MQRSLVGSEMCIRDRLSKFVIREALSLIQLLIPDPNFLLFNLLDELRINFLDPHCCQVTGSSVSQLVVDRLEIFEVLVLI